MSRFIKKTFIVLVNVEENLMVEISIQNKNGKKASVCKCKKTIKHRKHKEYCAWNSSICAYDYEKDCNMGKYLKGCICMKSLAGDLVATYDEILYTSEIKSINSTNKEFIGFFVLSY